MSESKKNNDKEYKTERNEKVNARRGRKTSASTKSKNSDDSENKWIQAKDIKNYMKHLPFYLVPRSMKQNAVVEEELDDVEKAESASGSANPGTSQRRTEDQKDEQETENVRPFPPFLPRTIQRKNENFALHGFQKGYKAEKIETLIENDGNVYFLIKWRGLGRPEWVSSAIARYHITDMVIDYYEKLIMWRD